MKNSDEDVPASAPAAYIQSLARGLEVIRAFGPEQTQMSLAEVARSTEMTRASSRRFLLTLEELGYVRAVGREFSLTPRVLELGYSYLSTLTFLSVVKPQLQQLAVELSEATSVAILDGSEIVVVARVPHHRLMSVSLALGSRFPATASAMGRTLLASLSQDELDAVLAEGPRRKLTERTIVDESELREEITRVRKQGWALVDGEVELGLLSMAAPVHKDGKTVAAINVATSAYRDTPTAMLAHARDPMMAVADRISTLLDQPFDEPYA